MVSDDLLTGFSDQDWHTVLNLISTAFNQNECDLIHIAFN